MHFNQIVVFGSNRQLGIRDAYVRKNRLCGLKEAQSLCLVSLLSDCGIRGVPNLVKIFV